MPSETRNYSNSGILFRNTKKQKSTDPDTKGDADVDGIKYWVNGWTHVDKNGNKYLTFRLTKKTSRNPNVKNSNDVSPYGV
jgi:hypothetical protein